MPVPFLKRLPPIFKVFGLKKDIYVSPSHAPHQPGRIKENQEPV